MIQPVEFRSEGATLRGVLYLPDGYSAPRPAVVMAHGTTATIKMVIDRYAEAFAAAGFAALTYDHRNLGVSDGEPRQEINPWVQARGYKDAISYVSTRTEVDPSRIAVWGDSYSGTQAIVLAAIDSRVRAVLAQCPVCGSRAGAPDPSGAKFAAISRTLLEGDVSGTPETTTGPLPVVSFDQIRHASLLKPISAFRWFMEYGGRHGTRWVNDVTRVIPATPAPFSPALCAPHVLCPILMMVAPDDEMVHCNYDVARATYDAVPGAKEWHEIAGGHFGLLWYPGPIFDEAARVQVDFLVRHLS
jgi:uncharacterized protein